MSIYKTSEVSLLDLTKLIGTLSSTIQAVLHACIQFLQQRQVVSLKQNAHQGKERVGMVGKQSETLQWSIGYTTTGTYPYSDRYIQQEMGSCILRDQNRASVVQEGARSIYQ